MKDNFLRHFTRFKPMPWQICIWRQEIRSLYCYFPIVLRLLKEQDEPLQLLLLPPSNRGADAFSSSDLRPKYVSFGALRNLLFLLLNTKGNFHLPFLRSSQLSFHLFQPDWAPDQEHSRHCRQSGWVCQQDSCHSGMGYPVGVVRWCGWEKGKFLDLGITLSWKLLHQLPWKACAKGLFSSERATT